MTFLLSHWRERLLAAVCVAGLLLVTSLATAPPSNAEICETFGYKANCRIVFGQENGGDGGDGDDGHEGPVRPLCNRGAPKYEEVPCDSDSSGKWSNERQCYVLEANDQPDPRDPSYRPGGKYYDCTGRTKDGQLFDKPSFWSAEPPETETGGSLEEDLKTALGVGFEAMYPGMAPEPVPTDNEGWDGYRMAPVGLWVWMWPREGFDGDIGPHKVTDESTGYMVSAKVKSMRWDMGDGSVISCSADSPAYQPWMKDRTPKCGHKYKRPGSYMVKVKTTWTVDYIDETGYQQVEIEPEPRSIVVRIGENQVVNR